MPQNGVGTILSHWHGNPAEMRPCAFFRKLTPDECNYDMGNRELLAIKPALEECRHWFEGAEHPILILTDHWNLIYVKYAKWFNPCQARWTLFFTRFNFTLTYRPGSKKVKGDALSCLDENPQAKPVPDTMIPEYCFVAPVRWELLEEIIREQKPGLNWMSTYTNLGAHKPWERMPSDGYTCSWARDSQASKKPKDFWNISFGRET